MFYNEMRVAMPLYVQVKQLIKEMIDKGELRPGDRVPGERELAERFRVSRMTARQALNELEAEGVLVRIQGKGSFVARPKIRQALLALTSFTEDMLLRGLTPHTKSLKTEVVEADRDLAELLGLVIPREVWRIERLRTADGEPMAFEVSYVPRRLCPDLDEQLRKEGSLYGVFERVYGLRLVRATQTIEAGIASREQGGLLGIKAGAAVLLLTRLTFTDEGVPVEYVKSVYRADRYKFVAELVRVAEGREPVRVTQKELPR